MFALLLQLPVPNHNVGARIGNIPLGPACLKLAAEDHAPEHRVDLFLQDLATYGGDAAIIDAICRMNPDILGLTLTCWNVERSLYIAREVKKRINLRVLAGGPEVTRDNPITRDEVIDFRIYGEGEEIFVRLLTDADFWSRKEAEGCAESFFTESRNPYLAGVLTPGVEEIMLLETQRGCPYGCKFCYYSKARSGLTFLSDEKVLEGISWAVQNGVKELYLLDPSLNARPGLKNLLKEIAKINTSKQVELRSEIRAEWIDKEAARLFADAGFTVFEIGLQSTGPEAQKLMGRKTDLKRFVEGVTHLKEVGILSTVDLIIGLPGDDLKSFSKSLGFVKENGLDDDMQVFPLALLPGTAFRKEALSLGLKYEKKPPYTVLETPGFSKEDIILALDWAESLFDMDLMAAPEVECAWLVKGGNKNREMRLAGDAYIVTLILKEEAALNDKARRLSSPYQVVIRSGISPDAVKGMLEALISTNPYTPLEIIWDRPDVLPDAAALVNNLPLSRPHFLDLDLALLEDRPGNRAIMTTLIQDASTDDLNVSMTRTLRRFTTENLPSLNTLTGLEEEVDGVLIDGEDGPEIEAFQNSLEELALEILPIAFSDQNAMERWRQNVLKEKFIW